MRLSRTLFALNAAFAELYSYPTWISWRIDTQRFNSILGKYCRLEPLDPKRHGDELFAASMAPDAAERFRYLPDAPQNRADFVGWLVRAATSEDPLFFAIIDLASERCEGRQSLMRITPEHGVIKVGNILWGPAIARTRVATEALYLFARYIFNDLGYRRFEWKCNARNAPSIRAAARFGFVYEGTFRQHMVVKGENRDTHGLPCWTSTGLPSPDHSNSGLTQQTLTAGPAKDSARRSPETQMNS